MKQVNVIYVSPERDAKIIKKVKIESLEKGKYKLSLMDETHIFKPDDIFLLYTFHGLFKKPFLIIYSGMNDAISPFREGDFIAPNEVEKLIKSSTVNLAILWSGQMLKFIEFTLFGVIIAIVIGIINLVI